MFRMIKNIYRTSARGFYKSFFDEMKPQNLFKKKSMPISSNFKIAATLASISYPYNGFNASTKKLESKESSDTSSPLISAIRENNCETLERLLKEGFKLKISDMFDAFDLAYGTVTELAVLELLDKYKALPHGLSMSTLKLTLYSIGNPHIKRSDFENEADLDWNGCPGFYSPMHHFSKSGRVEDAKWLMAHHVLERPIFNLTFPPVGNFLDIFDIKDFRQRISDILTGKNRSPGQCEIVELFIKNPTVDLDKVIYNKLHSGEIKNKVDDMGLFFVWAAINDKVDLLENKHFQQLTNIYPKAFLDALTVATVFNKKEFIQKSIATLPSTSDTTCLLNYAIADGNQALLTDVGNTLEAKFGKSVFNGDGDVDLLRADFDPFFCAIRFENIPAVHYLLEKNIDINKQDVRGTYLHLAVKMENLEIVSLLLNHGAKTDVMYYGTTPLQEACNLKQWDIAKLLISKNPSLLESIEDVTIKNKLANSSQSNIDNEPVVNNRLKR